METARDKRDREEFARLADLGRCLGHVAALGENGCLRCEVVFHHDIARHQNQQGRKFEQDELARIPYLRQVSRAHARQLIRRRAEYLALRGRLPAGRLLAS